MFKLIKQITVMAMLLCTGITVSAQEKIDQWPELKDFHAIISQTFHPSETGNLEPIKNLRGEMLDKANALSKSKVPAIFNAPAIPDAVKELLAEVKKLNTGMKKNKFTDEEIKKQLAVVHEAFHKIVEKCITIEK